MGTVNGLSEYLIPIIYYLNYKKNKILNQQLKNTKKTQKEIQVYQKNKIKLLLTNSKNNVQLYKEKYSKSGLKISNFKELFDLNKIPLLEKKELVRAGKNALSKKFDINNLVKSTTSGSTGIPLTSYINPESSQIDDVNWVRAFHLNGYKLTSKIAFLRTPRNFQNPSKFRFFGINRKENMSTFEPIEIQYKKLIKYKPDIIRSTPSSLELLSRKYGHELCDINPTKIYTTAEYLDDFQRKLINESFDTEVIDFYGTEELQLLAWECPEHNGYHINSDTVILEVIKDGELVAPGERGEIVVTHLNNYAMPYIRYRLNDIGVLSDEKCSCGVTFPLLKTIEGRKDDFLVTLNGRIVGPNARSFFDECIRRLDGVIQYQVIQKARDNLQVNLEFIEGFNLIWDNAMNEIEEEISSYFGGVQVSFNQVPEIPIEKSGKRRKLISRIDPFKIPE